MKVSPLGSIWCRNNRRPDRTSMASMVRGAPLATKPTTKTRPRASSRTILVAPAGTGAAATTRWCTKSRISADPPMRSTIRDHRGMMTDGVGTFVRGPALDPRETNAVPKRGVEAADDNLALITFPLACADRANGLAANDAATRPRPITTKPGQRITNSPYFLYNCYRQYEPMPNRRPRKTGNKLAIGGLLLVTPQGRSWAPPLPINLSPCIQFIPCARRLPRTTTTVM